ncbi:MAG: CPBP family intramembrane glutamic endopeptidase [Pyrinomonadaceae bacterium]
MQNYETTAAADFPQPTDNQVLTTVPQQPAPDNPPWNWAMGLLVWFASIVFIVIIPSAAIIFYVVSKGYNLTDTKQLAEAIQNDPTAILVNILAVIPAHLLTIAAAWAVVTNLNKFSFTKMLGWRWGGFKLWHLIVILVGFFGLAYLLTLVFGDQDNELLRILRSSRAVVYAVAFMATFTAPLVEEVIYRGVLYSSFQKRFGVSKAVFLATALFALVHVPQYYPNAATIISICVLSLVLTLIRAKTKNLLPCIVLHTVFNGIQSIGLILEPYLREQVQKTPDSAALILHLLK